MAFLDELGRKLSGMSRVAVRKAKEVTDIGGLKIQIADENRKLNKLYENLGREYYDMFKEAPDEDLEVLVLQVKDAVERIVGLETEVAKVEAESAAQAEADRIRREAEAEARRVSVAEGQMCEIHEEDGSEEAASETSEKASAEDESTETSESVSTEDESADASESISAEDESTETSKAVSVENVSSDIVEEGEEAASESENVEIQTKTGSNH